MNSNIITIESHIREAQRAFPGARGGFSSLLSNVAFAAKIIHSHVSRAGLVNILGATGAENVQGEQVQKLDEFADDCLIRIVGRGGQVAIMGSEEHPGPIEIPDGYDQGDYVLLFDPLDGSSNIDVMATIGTIFSILKRVTPKNEEPGLEDLLQPGYRQVAAGYVIYGSSTMLVYSAGLGVHGFTLDPAVGEFLLSHPDIRMPDPGPYFSVNEGNAPYWDDATRAVVDAFKYGNETTPPLSGRYIGSLAGDFHRNLLRGGVFLYPAVRKSPDAPPKPKLRLLYEAAPIAFLADQAGGYASDGTGPLLRLQPRELHERVALIVGSSKQVRMAEAMLREHAPSTTPQAD